MPFYSSKFQFGVFITHYLLSIISNIDFIGRGGSAPTCDALRGAWCLMDCEPVSFDSNPTNGKSMTSLNPELVADRHLAICVLKEGQQLLDGKLFHRTDSRQSNICAPRVSCF